MTDEIMNLRALLEKSSDADLLREMIGFTCTPHGSAVGRVHFMRNVLAYAGRQGRRVVAAFIGTSFVQDDAEGRDLNSI